MSPPPPLQLSLHHNFTSRHFSFSSRVENFEGALQQAEQRDKDRLVILRDTIRNSLSSGTGNAAVTSADVDAVVVQLEKDHKSVDQADKDWDSYRNSFTILMSKGYLQTVDQLRDKLMATEWELGLKPIAMQL